MTTARQLRVSHHDCNSGRNRDSVNGVLPSYKAFPHTGNSTVVTSEGARHTLLPCNSNTGVLFLVNGSWGPWSQWSICSRTCDIGQRRRIRRCDSPAPSNGGQHCNFSGDSAVDVVNCKMDDCPDLLPSWNKWGPWSACSVTCSSGISTRNRTCKHNTMLNECSGEHKESTDCYLNPCPGSSNSSDLYLNFSQEA